MNPRSVVVTPPIMSPENPIRIRVAQAITNQVLTSWLLATSPRSSASSSRFWVGSSERSVSSWPSAMGPQDSNPLCVRRKFAQHGFDRAEEQRHHRADDQEQDQKTNQDRYREADEEHLHLRHQPRQ